jgi:hypothetical protein
MCLLRENEERPKPSQLPTIKKETKMPPDLTPIYVAAGMLRAQVIKSKLEASGIPVLLDYESIGPIIGITVDGLGEVRVLVPDEHADEARQLLQEEDSEDS